MVTKKITIFSLYLVLFTLSSNFAVAAENASTNASFAGWPLLLLIAGLVIFRKKIFSEAMVDEKETSDHSLAEQKKPEATTPSPETVPVKEPPSKTAIKTKAKTSIKKDKPKNNASSIDLSNDTQCQASTTKGTRCKRTTALEKTSLTINNKTYQLKVCSQHNNDKFKPFKDLIK